MSRGVVLRSRRITAILFGVGIVFAAAIVLWPGVRSRAAAPPAAPTYVVVAPTTYRASVPAPGTLRAVTRAEVRTATAGTIAWVAPVGTRVAVGDVVARLERAPLERTERDASLAVDRARRGLEVAEVDAVETERSLTVSLETAERRLEDARLREGATHEALALSERLAALGAESPRALEAARDAVAAAAVAVRDGERDVTTARDTLALRVQRSRDDVANAREAVVSAELTLERAREDLAATELRARVAGVVDRADGVVGSTVAANALIASVADDAALHLVAQVDETEVGRVLVGQRASIAVVAAPSLRPTGEVVAVAPTAHTAQNIPVFEVTIALANDGLALRPGMTAEAEIVVREVEGTITVPSRALLRGNELAELLGAAAFEPSRVPGAAARVPEAAAARLAERPRGSDPEVGQALRDRAAGMAAGGPAAGREGLPGLQGAGAWRDALTAPSTWQGGEGAAAAASRAAVRARDSEGVVSLHLAEVVATIGASSVIRVDLPPGWEIEVPPAPTVAQQAPARAPAVSIPGFGGSARIGVGGR